MSIDIAMILIITAFAAGVIIGEFNTPKSNDYGTAYDKYVEYVEDLNEENYTFLEWLQSKLTNSNLRKGPHPVETCTCPKCKQVSGRS